MGSLRMLTTWTTLVFTFMILCLKGCGPGTSSSQNPPDETRMCTQLFPAKDGKTTTHIIEPKGVGEIACKWKKRALTVRFLDGAPEIQGKVRSIAQEWEKHCSIRFVFGNEREADIRISFQPGGSWSYVGKCTYGRSPDQATMNYGWLTPTTPEVEYRRVVLHEFGHALGFVHEHQHPGVPIQWNEQAVYEYYQRTQGWDREETRSNILTKYAKEETNYTKYDSASIMHYAIPKQLTLNGFSVGWNTELSEQDKAFIKSNYP